MYTLLPHCEVLYYMNLKGKKVVVQFVPQTKIKQIQMNLRTEEVLYCTNGSEKQSTKS